MSAISERSEQAALFDWAAWQSGQHPELEMLFAIPNGQMRRGMPLEPGLKKGVPDIFLACPNEHYNGLFIELKVGDNQLAPEQVKWLDMLAEQGYQAFVCYGFDEAKEIICEYLGIAND